LRLSELLAAPAVDADDRPLGRVRDVRLVQDGPIVDGFGHALRVAGILVGDRFTGTRLGFLRADVGGPWPLTAIFRRFERRAAYYDWADVQAWEPGSVRLRRGAQPTDPPG
jgi:hypothetical protein